MLKLKNTSSLLLAVGLLAVSAPALADEDDRHYLQNQSRYISYEQAAKIAAGKIPGGRVGEVDFEYSHIGGARFEVEVYGQDGEYDVILDAKTGKVLSVQRDY